MDVASQLVRDATDLSGGLDHNHPPDDYLLVGGGLQNALVTLALLERRPATRLTLIERDPRLGGNHTWCFHAGDVPEEARSWIAPLVVQRWPSHEVRFARYRRRLEQEYCALTSERLHEVVSERVRRSAHARIVTAEVLSAAPGRVTLQDGSSRRAQLVIDARGPLATVTGGIRAAETQAAGIRAYQKFLGLELQLASPSAPEIPVLMDATVEQLDGFRFLYLLPLAPDRVLLEDTYYSDDSRLDRPALTQRILEYARQRGMPVQRIVREESGVLPLPTRSALPAGADGLIHGGYAGGLFHPTTGYSLPVALRFALYIASTSPAEAAGERHAEWLKQHARQARYAVRLNRLLFDAFAPEQRHHVLERFYRLPEATIRRFYALQTTRLDRARILCGRPPSGFSLSLLISKGTSA